MKVIIVGFKVTEDNSVFYRKVDVIPQDTHSDGKLIQAFRQAIEKSDFISIRINREATNDRDKTGG